MKYEEARERLGLCQGVIEEVTDEVADEHARFSLDEAARDLNAAIARLDALQSGNTTSIPENSNEGMK